MVSIKKKENHTTLLLSPLKGNRAWLQRPPLSYLLKLSISNDYIWPPPAFIRIAESLHRKIQIVSHAVRLLEHKLRQRHCCQWVIHLALLIHKRWRFKGCCWKVLDCVADAAVTYGLMWVFICSNCQKYISPWVVCPVQVIVLITAMTDCSPACANYSAYSLLLIFFFVCTYD